MRAGPDHGELLERGAELQALHDVLDAVDPRAPGRLVLIAGGGRRQDRPDPPLLRRRLPAGLRALGACDPLFTPRPLGPLFDVAGEVGGALEAFVFGGGGAPHEVIGPLADALRSRVPTVFVLEDVHWADEATLDVLRLLAR